MESEKQSEECLTIPIIVYTISAFIGNFGITVTGFGQAIIFLFLYTIADISHILNCSKCGLKHTIFLQTISLGAALPLMIFKMRHEIKIHWNGELLVIFIPATIVGTPIGNFLQKFMDPDLLRTVVGAMITFVIFVEFNNMFQWTMCSSDRKSWYLHQQGNSYCCSCCSCCFRNNWMNENNEETKDEKHQSTVGGMIFFPIQSEQPSSSIDAHTCENEHTLESKMNELTDTTKHCHNEKNYVVVVNSDSTPIAFDKETKPCVQTNNTVDVKIYCSPNEEEEGEEEGEGERGGEETNSNTSTSSINQSLPTGWKVRIWGIILGFLSGFLGGLMGVRGPPLMIFFLMFSFPKNVVRANAVLILLVNISIRIAYYIVEDLSSSNATSTNTTTTTTTSNDLWFDSDYTIMYICVLCFGMLGVPIGDYVALKLNQQQFKMILAFFLLFSGLSNLVKGSINLAKH